MPGVSVTVAEQAFIQERIEHFAEEAPANIQWQLPYVRTHGALPLYIGWTETAGIRPDGTLVRWSTEGDWAGAQELRDDIWVKAALVEGAARYPPLRRLIPARPERARTCSACDGVGRFPIRPEILCQCGGVGWIDDTGDPP